MVVEEVGINIKIDTTMKRIVKFRGKSKRTGEWLYGDLVRNVEGAFAIVHPFEMTTDNLCDRYEVDENTIGQFTSLYSCHGKEIYEGDILDFNGLKIEVRFVRGVFALLCNGDLDQEMCGDCRTDLFAKIIGNIHDNSELLNQND